MSRPSFFSWSAAGVDRRWLAAAFAYAAVVFFVSSRPYLRPMGPEFELKDNLAHAIEYGVLATLLFRALAPLTWPDAATTFLLIVAVAASVGAADEVFQGTVPGRRRDIADWASDTTGAALAAAVCVWRARRTRATGMAP
ncbi:MAG TPA: VanZ family protein [Candidatus Krumholzibacteria bacterium]|nr:VanZ family protein [Candidatus Krumholzibacteria bacterium]